MRKFDQNDMIGSDYVEFLKTTQRDQCFEVTSKLKLILTYIYRPTNI